MNMLQVGCTEKGEFCAMELQVYINAGYHPSPVINGYVSVLTQYQLMH